MITLLKRMLKSMVILAIGIVAINALLWVGQQDYQEAQHRQERLENYDTMVKNANEGNHHLNRAYIGGESYDK